jgi:NAD(P)H dehydrogenase (quinone)
MRPQVSTLTVAVLFHSGYGHTKVVAESLFAGVSSVAGITAHLISVDELPAPGADRSLGGKWQLLQAADCIVFGTPTYMGGVSAKFKEFADRSSSIWFKQGWKDKLAAGFSNSGNLSGDRLSSLQYLSLFASQHGMVWINLGMLPGNPHDANTPNRVGSSLDLMTHSDQASPEVTPGKGDREAARLFGVRIAQTTLRWTK